MLVLPGDESVIVVGVTPSAIGVQVVRAVPVVTGAVVVVVDTVVVGVVDVFAVVAGVVEAAVPHQGLLPIPLLLRLLLRLHRRIIRMIRTKGIRLL